MSKNGPAGGRVWTRPLVVFVLAVVAILLSAAWQRYRTPGPDEAILLLADGDLDGEERTRMLRVLVAAAQRSEQPRDQWAGMLAAIPLGDRSGHAAVKALLGPGAVPTILPKPMERELLHLGDPMLANLLQALLEEAAGQAGPALVRWQMVEAQARLTGSSFATELATAAMQRLR